MQNIPDIFFRKMSLILFAIEDIGLGNQTRLHKANNELSQVIDGINIQDVSCIEKLNSKVNKCEEIINELIKELNVSDINKLLFKLRRKNNISDITICGIKIILNCNSIELTKFRSFGCKVNDLIINLKLLELLEDGNLLSGAMYNFNKYLNIQLENPEIPLTENLIHINNKLEELVCCLCNLTNTADIDSLRTKLCSKEHLDSALRYNIKEVLRPPIAKVNVTSEDEYSSLSPVTEVIPFNKNSSIKSIRKDLKKLLKSLKVLGLDKNTNLYNLYKELKQEIKKKDKLGSTLDDSMMCKLCEITDIVNKLMSMTKIGNLSDLINYLEFQEYEIVDAIKIRYFLINGDELFNLEYSDNVTLNIFKAHDSFIESLCSDFKENLKTSLSSLSQREDIVDGKRITNVRIDVNFSLTDVTKVV